MFFTSRTKLKQCPEITINGQKIKNVHKFKYLGVTLDSTLTFKYHISTFANSMRFNIASYRYIRNSLTLEASSTYLNAMIVSHLSYCITSWSQASKTTQKSLESLYKRSLKIHDKKPRHYHHCNILLTHNILSFENLITHSNICLLFKIIHNTAPPPLRHFVKLSSEVMTRTTRSTTQGACRIPVRKKAIGQSSFTYIAIKQWNELPTELTTITNFHTFSRSTKQWLLAQQCCTHL